jgi:23S rRNA (pseudouridine1915-N3)-methyltransferase
LIKLRIIQVGKTKDAWLNEGIAEYVKRLTAFVHLDVIELADESLKNAANPEQVKEKEAITIMKRIDRDAYVILLDEKGEAKTSLEFADFLINLSEKVNVVFVIGGVFGVAQSIYERANYCFTLSRLTFTHRMARLILVEQIYRAMMINANRNYHV